MHHKKLPIASDLNERFLYSESNGELTYRTDSGYRIKAGMRAGSIKRNGYRQVSINGKVYAEHRLIWRMVTGQDPGELTVDHINEIKDDNRFDNLRLATEKEQARYWIKNHSQKWRQKNSYSPRCRYYYKDRRNTWQVIMRIDGKTKYCGTFLTEQEAQRQVEIEKLKNPRC